jgi:hypothetical protein
MAFSPDSKTFASGDSTVILWDIEVQSWEKKACQRVGRNFTQAEWVRYFPGEEFRKTCEQYPLKLEVTATVTP